MKSASCFDGFITMSDLSPDDLFEKLEELTEKRLRLMPAVARWKADRSLPVGDAWREQQLLEDFCSRGRSSGINPEFIRFFFTSQMQFAREIQMLSQMLSSDESEQKDTEPGDLELVFRPGIREISMEMLQILIQLYQLLNAEATDAPFHARLISRLEEGITHSVNKVLREILAQTSRKA